MKNLTMTSLIKSTLKHRKKQYTLMILGIVFAMMFSSGTLFFISSLNSTKEEMLRMEYGNCDCIIVGHEKEDYDSYISGGYFSEYGVTNIVGSMYSEDSKDTPVNVGYMDEKAKELYYLAFIEGTYPEDEGEIALEKSALTRIDPDLKVGESFTVEFRSQNGNELMEKTGKRTFKLTGILKTKNINGYIVDSSFSALPTAFVVSDKIMDQGAKTNLCYYMNFQSEEAEFNFRTSNKNKLYDSEGSFIEFDGIKYTTVGGSGIYTVIFILVLLVASLMIIVNAINANINERKKQIGMLRTVGATKRQIREIFMRESLVLTLISTPISILLSFLGVKVFAYFSNDGIVFVFDFWILILGAAFGVISILIATVVPLFSASRISPVQSIRNIENARTMKRKKIKSQLDFAVSDLLAKRNLSFYKSKQIAVSLILAITIIFSSYGFGLLKQELSFAEVYHYDYGMYDYNYTQDNCINYRNTNAGFSENHRQGLKRIPGVKEVYVRKSMEVLIEKDEYSTYDIISQLNSTNFFQEEPHYVETTASQAQIEAHEQWEKEGFYEFSEDYYETKNYVEAEKEIVSYSLKSAKEDRFEAIEKYVTDGKINYDKLASGEEVILVAPEKVAYLSTSNVEGICINEEIKADEEYKFIAESPYKAGDTFDLIIAYGDYDEETWSFKNIETKRKQVKVGAIISELPDERRIVEDFSGNNFFLLTTNEGFLNFDSEKRYGNIYVELEGECDEEIDKEVMDYLEGLSYLKPKSYHYSKYQFELDGNQSIKAFALAMLSIIVLFCAIGISIINNSIASRIKASKREMGILRAVGATDKVLTLSYIKQLRSMFIWGISAGYIGYAASYAILAYREFELYRQHHIEPHFDNLIPIVILPSVIVVVTYLGICSLNLYIKIKNETKNSIIDNIREL